MPTAAESSPEDSSTSASTSAAAVAVQGESAGKNVSLAEFLEQGFASALPSASSKSTTTTAAVLINCLDPGATNSISSRNSDSRPKWEPHISLNQRFATIFSEAPYHSQIHRVSFQDARSQATTEIPHIHVQCRLLESQVDLLHNLGEPETSTPQQVHTLPYCWVYFVMCTTVDEYRKKVKPAMQVFLSQLQDIYQQAGAASDSLKPSVLFIYCPTRPVGSNPILPEAAGGDPDDPTNSATATGPSSSSLSSNRPALTLANRLRQRMTSGSSSAPSNTDTTSTTTTPAPAAGDTTSTGEQQDTSTATTATSSDNTAMTEFDPLLALTKIEKDIAKRLATDFAHGHHAVLTTLGNDYSHLNKHAYKKNLIDELQRGEWAVLLQTLGQAIIDGFHKACQILQAQWDELNRDQLPASVGSANANTGKLFRLKSQWAFLYEPLHLPAQALLQYNELRALLPDLSTTLRLYQHVHDAAATGVEELEGLAGVRSAGDTEGAKAIAIVETWLDQEAFCLTRTDALFDSMQQVHGENYFLLAPTVEKYLWEREVALLLEMGQVAEALERSFHMVVSVWEYQSQYLGNKGDDKPLQVQRRLGEWAVAVCWDLKRCVQAFLQDAKKKSAVEPLAKTLCQILEFGRQLLRQLAQDCAPEIESVTPTLPYPDLVDSWDVWTLEMAKSNEFKDFIPESDDKGTEFVNGALASRSSFVSRYMQISRVAVSLNQHAGRQRTAARLSMELVAWHLERGELVAAAACLKQIKIYGREGWKALNFGVHFRLAGLRRKLSVPAEYLATIVSCFGKRLQSNHFSPTKALEVLHRDMEAVLSVLYPGGPDNSVTFTNSPVFETLLKFSNSKAVKGRKALRRVYSIGETVEVTLVMTSHLAQSIDSISVKAALVPYKLYVAAQEDGKSLLSSSDSLSIALPGSSTIKPGENEFQFSFKPIISGQFVLSMVSATYSAATFNYSYEKMKEPFRIDILPGEPTQSMSTKPVFLVPGHEQQLQVEFQAGEDDVEKGELDLVCSPGLVVRPSGSDSEGWSPNCMLPLQKGEPGSKQVFTVNVKSLSTHGTPDDQTEVSSAAPSVHAKITSSYTFQRTLREECQLLDGSGNVAKSSFQNEMENVVPTLGDRALSVEHVSLNPYSPSKLVLSLAIRCHLPQQVVLKKWALDLPSRLLLTESVAVNEMNMGTSLQKGETVNFSFDCSYEKSEQKLGEGLLVVELQDEYEGVFEEKLPLRIAFNALPSSQIPSDLQKLTVDARFLSSECRVGSATKIQYELSSTDLSKWGGTLYFKLDTRNDFWLIAGNSHGQMVFDGSFWKHEAVLIPARPDASSNLPSVQVALDGNGLAKPFSFMPPVRVKTRELISVDLRCSSIAFSVSTSDRQLFSV